MNFRSSIHDPDTDITRNGK